MVTGLNHLTLAVSDLDRSVTFYRELLGFTVRMHGASSAYLEAGTLWLALVRDADVRHGPLPDYSHIALNVSATELPLVMDRLSRGGARSWQDAGRSDSFYFLDPDGHKLELHSGDLPSRPAASSLPHAAKRKNLICCTNRTQLHTALAHDA